jgi:hypothetical protein
VVAIVLKQPAGGLARLAARGGEAGGNGLGPLAMRRAAGLGRSAAVRGLASRLGQCGLKRRSVGGHAVCRIKHG